MLYVFVPFYTGLSYIYKSWNRNNTCPGTPSSSQSIPIIKACAPYYSNSYSSESCTAVEEVKPSSKVSCFAGSETVEVEGLGTREISSISVGDKILTTDVYGQFGYSNVIAVPHERNYELVDFVQLFTHSHRDLKLTGAHLLLVSCSDEDSNNDSINNDSHQREFSLLRADAVRIGCRVSTIEGPEVIIEINQIKSQGIYTVVTKAEYIVVNGFVASSFAVSHSLGQAYYAIYEALAIRHWLPKSLQIAFNSVITSILNSIL